MILKMTQSKTKKWLVLVIGNQESSNVSIYIVKLSDRTEMKYLQLSYD